MEYICEIDRNVEALDPFAAEETEVIQYEKPNPFYLPMEGSEIKYTKNKILADEYDHVYILCLSNDFEVTDSNKNKIRLFYQPDSDSKELIGQSKLVTLVQAPFCFVNLQSIRSGLIPIGKEILEVFNHDSVQLKSKELVYLMLETKERHVRDWIKLHQSENNLDEFVQQKIFASYYRINDKKLDNHLLSLIGRVDDFKFWQNDRNCSLSINNAFNSRKFNLDFQRWNLPIKEIEKELQKLLQNFKENKTTLKASTYPTQITNPSEADEPRIDPLKMKPYVDGAQRDNNSYYPVTKCEELEIKKESIQELLMSHSLTEKEKYYLISGLLASKSYCHYVLGNIEILNANKDLFEKYKPIFRYLMGYAWISLYMEESIRKTKIKQSDRFVFDINTAAALPVFPHSPQAPYMNPYFCCMVSDTVLNAGENINSVKQPLEYQNGIVNFEEFKRRLNIFVTGKETVNLLDGANWSNMAITGGTMAALIPKTNPLMALFKKNADAKVPMTEQELDRFYQEYYAKSDVDIACNHTNILDFIEHVKHMRRVIHQNLGNQIKESEIQISPTKTLAIFINAKVLKEKCDRKDVPYAYDYVINHKTKRSVKFYFYELYLEQKKLANQKNRQVLGEKINDDEYFEIIDYCEFDKTVIIINDVLFENHVIENRTPESNSGIEMVYLIKAGINNVPVIESETEERENNNDSNVFIQFSETLKYKITSKHLKHPFEIFRINGIEFFSSVSRFHLPCVRSYYNGTNCYLLPSAISAYQTLTNIDFKYFVGNNDPISIIDKYRKRGYGIVLNKTEINQYLSYIMARGNYKMGYGIADTKDIKNIIGCLDINHDFYKPRKMVPEDFVADPSIKLDYQTPKLEQLTKEELVKFYKKKYTKYTDEFMEKRTIASTGQIEPLKYWMVEASYDLLQQ